MSLVTWNPNDKGNGVVLSNSNLTAENEYRKHLNIRATVGKSSGKWYWEVTPLQNFSNIKAMGIGVGDSSEVGVVFEGISSVASVRYYQSSTLRLFEGINEKRPQNNIPMYIGNVISVLLDMDNKTVEFKNEGVTVHVFSIDRIITANAYPLIDIFQMSSLANFGATPFKYKVPNGYLPYDYENASWLKPNKYLLQQNNKILTIESNALVETMLQEPLTRVDFEEFGFNNLNLLLDKDLSNATLLINPYDKTTVSKVIVKAVPKPKMILPIKDIYLRILNNIQSFTVTSIGDVIGTIRLIFSVNSGASWQTLDSATRQFKTISNIEDLNEVKSKGMTIETFNSIGLKWNEVIKGMKVRFGYYLEIEEIYDIANVDKLEVVMDVLGSWDALIHELDYDYEYDNEKIYIELYRDGSYKINYI